MSAEDNATLVRTIYSAFNDHDLDRVVALVADDFELLDVAAGQTYRGPEGFRAWLQPWLTAAPDAKTELTSVLASGDWVVTEHTGRGRHSGPLATPAGEIPASGRAIELRFAEFFEVRAGKITRMRAYWDSATLLRQVGALG